MKSSFFSGKTKSMTAKNNRKQIVTIILIGIKITTKKKKVRQVKYVSMRNIGRLESNKFSPKES